MAWNPLYETLDALNAIWGFLYGMIDTFVYHFLNLVTLILYPLYYGLSVLEMDINSIYIPLAQMYNGVVTISQIPATLFQNVFQLPPMWTTLLLISISISCSIRLYRWAREVRGWIPTMSGD